MSHQFTLTLLLLATCVALAAANRSGLAEATKAKAALSLIQPRFLWSKHGESKAQTPIVIYSSPNNAGAERHHQHYPQYPTPSFYPFLFPVPQTPSTPSTPPFNIPGIPADFFRQGTPSIVIINPNNAQNLTFPAAAAAAAPAAAPAAAAGTGRNGNTRRSSIPLLDLLSQGSAVEDEVTDAINAPENVEVPELPAAVVSPAIVVYGGEDRDEDIAEDEQALLERHSERGLSPKNLLSFLLEDKRRKRIQEAVAGFYLRQYNVNRK